MPLNVTNVSQNPQVPGIAAEAFIPDQLIAGELKIVTGAVTLTGAAALKRGAVLGKTVSAGTASSAPGTNTGNGAMGAITVAGDAQPGTYQLKITKAAANAGDFEVTDPLGQLVGLGTVAVAFAGAGLSFTLADGAIDFAVGDSFTISVTAITEKYKLAARDATDGSNEPQAILADDADPSGGDVQAGVYFTGEFNANALSFGTNLSAALVKAPLRRLGIFIKDAVSASDPS
jgi:hypothetical protein